MYIEKKKIKYQILLNKGKYILNNMENNQMEVDKDRRKLWRAAQEILEQFRMENRPNFGNVGSFHKMIEYGETKRNMSMKDIEFKKEIDQ
jgi:hypothetical protein